jgi:hypothetical protein
MLQSIPKEDKGCFRTFLPALIIIILSMLVMCEGKAQNAIYVAIQPVDVGIGIRGDYYFNDIGAYSSVSYGNGGLYKHFNMQHHVKLTTGVLIPLPDYQTWKYDFTVGINYHYIHDATINNISVDPEIFNPLSFELGLAVKMKYLAIGIRTDILRWEPCVDVGYVFKYHKYYRK